MKKILMVLMVSTLVLFGSACGKKEENKPNDNKPGENTPIANNKEEVTKDREVEGMKLTNIAVIRENGLSNVTILVSNDTEADYTVNQYQIVFKDKDGNSIVFQPLTYTVPNGVIKAGETITLSTGTDADLTEATTMEVTAVK